MKAEAYLTPESHNKAVSHWLSILGRRKRWESGLGNAALLILDLQEYFTNPASHAYIPSTQTILPIIGSLLDRFPGPILRTQHIQPDDSKNRMTQWWKRRLDGPMACLDPSISSIRGEVIQKEHYSAFFNTPLNTLLISKGVDSVILTGVMTDLCCETTARDAFMHGFKVFFLADATATATEARHIRSLQSIATGFGEVLSSEELMLLL